MKIKDGAVIRGSGRTTYRKGDEKALLAEISPENGKRLADVGLVTLDGKEKFGQKNAGRGRFRGPSRPRDPGARDLSDEELAELVEARGLRLVGDGDGDDQDDQALADMTREELADLAQARGVEVTRADGADGDPLKADYLRALKAE